VNKFEQFLAKILLLTSLYMHFFIEHNKGHHKHVATPEDPSTAFYKQHLYAFWIQTFIGTQKKAWQIATSEAKGSIFNEMALFQLIQFALVGLIYYFFGGFVLVCFLVAAFIGAALLETVNYIEHYGLQRDFAKTTFERVKPAHSWNSNHLMGRLTLFELSRHSDHHYLASRKYQILRHMEDAPQMPTGYPGMILLALFPPIWFKVMHRQMDRFGITPR
jgi:alkane 1-monooxygenase